MFPSLLALQTCFTASVSQPHHTEGKSDAQGGWCWRQLHGRRLQLCCLRLRNGLCSPGGDAEEVFPLLLGTCCQSPHQNMLSDMAFNSQLTLRSKQPVYAESMCNVWAPSLLRGRWHYSSLLSL